MKKISFYGSLALAVFFFFGSHAAYAAKECIPKTQIDSLTAAENSGDDYSVAIKKELVIRKDILKTIISCNIDEVTTPENTLQAITFTDPAMQRLQSQFLGELNDAIAYYQNQGSKINDLGISGSQELARTIRTWRMYNEFPLLDKTANLIMWSRNQALLETAQSRMDDISQTVKALKVVDSDNVQNLFSKAQGSFNDAQTANDQAKEILKNGGDSASALQNIKESLDSLSQMYKTFFDLSDAVNKILPHNK